MIKKRKSQLTLLLFCYIFLCFGCEIFDKPEQIPSYIKIEAVGLQDNASINEGSLSNKIVDVWIYIDDQLIGAFELPCLFPVLLEGEHEIAVYAGIYMNGVRTTRVYYPFYSVWKDSINLVPDSIVTLSPVVTYHDLIKMPLHESFESAGVNLEADQKSVAVLTKTSDKSEVFEGNYSGKVVLNKDDSIYLGVSIQEYQLPTAGGHVFLEMDYKTEADIIVGLYAIKPAQILQLEVAGVKPRDEWGKIYINLTPTVFRENDALSFKIFLGSVLPAGKTEATILIDNIKLIHF